MVPVRNLAVVLGDRPPGGVEAVRRVAVADMFEGDTAVAAVVAAAADPNHRVAPVVAAHKELALVVVAGNMNLRHRRAAVDCRT